MNNNKPLLVECRTFECDPKVLSESLSGYGPFIVKGILQRANVKNQNDRVYRKETLVREAAKYENEYVKERRALGELDHPESCFSKSAQILTKSGWKYIKDISENEEVLTLNIYTNKPEYQKINKKIDQKYSGTMYRLKGKNINTLVTPNHRFVVEDRYGERSFKTAEELFTINKEGFSHLKIPKSNDCFEADSPKNFVLKGIPAEKLSKRLRKDLLEKYTKDVEIPYDVWMSFMGIYLSEGHYRGCRRDGNPSNRKSNCVNITQKNKEKVQKIKDMLSKFPSELAWKHTICKNNTSNFSICDARLLNYLSPLGSCYTKYVPEELKNQSAPLLECLLEWYHMGDGRDVCYQGYNSKSIFSASQKLMEDFQEIQLKIGGCGNVLQQITPKDYVFAGHTIKKENCKPLHVLKFNHSRYIHIDPRFLEITQESFDDRVYCVSVPNETFYCKDNNQCFWSGNSVVNLQNVSHNVIEMHWDGDDLVGTIEILSTPNGNILKELFKSNIRLGISSRGMGTVKKDLREDVDVVQDDFSLISFDFVSNPSTRGAFMFAASPLKEGVIAKPIDNKWEKVEFLIRDILSEVK